MNLNLTLIAQAAMFALFIWFTKSIIWPHLLRAIEVRQKNIADGLAAAEQGRKSLEASAKQVSLTLGEARTRAGDIIAQAEKRASGLIEEAQHAAREEGSREKVAALAEIEQELARAREMLREQLATLAVAGAERILRREVNPQAHSELLAQLRTQI